VRVLGISESFIKGVSRKSVLAGVVMRTNMTIEDFVLSKATVGGMDATEKIIAMYKTLERDDVTLIMLNGCIISWYNVVDLHKVSAETRLPLICVTYKASEGLEKYFRELFTKDWEVRMAIYTKNKSRISMKLDTGYTIYIRFIDMFFEEAKKILNKFTRQGSIPEPLRVSRLIARSMINV
jgi:endonuclease V-like protein UPF0215 family